MLSGLAKDADELVHLALDGPTATLDAKDAPELVHAGLEAMSAHPKSR